MDESESWIRAEVERMLAERRELDFACELLGIEVAALREEGPARRGE